MQAAPKIRAVRTYSEEWLARHRATHAAHAVFGTHRHPYLRDRIADLAAAIGGPERPSLLDYGCGKGVFLAEMARSGLFRYVRGYDPAVDQFKTRPAQGYDLVLCLDVLDQIEDEFVAAVIDDVAQLALRFVLFDVITVQTPALAHLNPRSAAQWRDIIGRELEVVETEVRPASAEELAEGACPERVIVTAASRRT